MGVKKLRSIFMRYIFTVAGGILFIIAVNVGLYMLCINTEVIIPAMNIEDRIADAAEKIQADKLFDTADIPSFCDYGVYSPTGAFRYGSLSEDTADTFWEKAATNGKNVIHPYRVRIVDRGDEVILLRYRLTSQFSNPVLRRICPTSDFCLVGLIIIETIVLLLLVSHWFGKYTGRKIEKLLIVTQEIEKQDLDFKIESSGIFEVDRALSALEHLKQALKNSLAEQWQADKLRQEQISALAHDLKTPLTIIRGNTELLYDTILADNQKECADYIEGSVVQMQDYVETLIDMTKAKENFSFRRENVKLSFLLQEIHTQAKGLCAVKNIHLEWRENVDREYIFADSEQLIRGFANVLSNAIEYTPAGKTVFFEVHEKDNSILCSITDMGSGFSPEALKHATEQFYMGEQSRHSKSHYGIGLYVADSIIAQHGGQLILSNSEKTGGAQVIIKIPY
ncbi:HAMP domain-containing sensor histidine kinase [Candidatus Merdisoma sp. JLR.KK006]|uniref:sensor histidine kinase n=1 Tax=Candidatus Merdisoma sp. JLR.KK006 TaxID=3112626 RepID=UPI002FF14768